MRAIVLIPDIAQTTPAYARLQDACLQEVPSGLVFGQYPPL